MPKKAKKRVRTDSDSESDNSDGHSPSPAAAGSKPPAAAGSKKASPSKSSAAAEPQPEPKPKSPAAAGPKVGKAAPSLQYFSGTNPIFLYEDEACSTPACLPNGDDRQISFGNVLYLGERFKGKQDGRNYNTRAVVAFELEKPLDSPLFVPIGNAQGQPFWSGIKPHHPHVPGAAGATFQKFAPIAKPENPEENSPQHQSDRIAEIKGHVVFHRTQAAFSSGYLNSVRDAFPPAQRARFDAIADHDSLLKLLDQLDRLSTEQRREEAFVKCSKLAALDHKTLASHCVAVLKEYGQWFNAAQIRKAFEDALMRRIKEERSSEASVTLFVHQNATFPAELELEAALGKIGTNFDETISALGRLNDEASKAPKEQTKVINTVRRGTTYSHSALANYNRLHSRDKKRERSRSPRARERSRSYSCSSNTSFRSRSRSRSRKRSNERSSNYSRSKRERERSSSSFSSFSNYSTSSRSRSRSPKRRESREDHDSSKSKEKVKPSASTKEEKKKPPPRTFKKSSEKCRNFAEGKCTRGASCRYVHTVPSNYSLTLKNTGTESVSDIYCNHGTLESAAVESAMTDNLANSAAGHLDENNCNINASAQPIVASALTAKGAHATDVSLVPSNYSLTLKQKLSPQLANARTRAQGVASLHKHMQSVSSLPPQVTLINTGTESVSDIYCNHGTLESAAVESAMTDNLANSAAGHLDENNCNINASAQPIVASALTAKGAHATDVSLALTDHLGEPVHVRVTISNNAKLPLERRMYSDANVEVLDSSKQSFPNPKESQSLGSSESIAPTIEPPLVASRERLRSSGSNVLNKKQANPKWSGLNRVQREVNTITRRRKRDTRKREAEVLHQAEQKREGLLKHLISIYKLGDEAVAEHFRTANCMDCKQFLPAVEQTDTVHSVNLPRKASPILVRAEVAGKPLLVMLDTGASINVVATNVAPLLLQHGAREISKPTQYLRTAGGTVEGKFSNIQTEIRFENAVNQLPVTFTVMPENSLYKDTIILGAPWLIANECCMRLGIPSTIHINKALDKNNKPVELRICSNDDELVTNMLHSMIHSEEGSDEEAEPDSAESISEISSWGKRLREDEEAIEETRRAQEEFPSVMIITGPDGKKLLPEAEGPRSMQEAKEKPIAEKKSNEPIYGHKNLTEEQIKTLKEVVQQTGLLRPRKLSETPAAAKFKLEYKPNGKLPKLPPYRVSAAKQEEIKTLVQELLDAGVIEPCAGSPWSSPVSVVTKGAKKRLVYDYRTLNAATVPDRFPLPRIDDLINQFSNKGFFTVMDLSSAFHHIEIESEEDRNAMAFITMDAHYRPTRLPFGLAQAPAQMQRLMNKIMAPHRKFSAVYLDDIIIFSKTFEEHLEHIKAIAKTLEDSNLTVKPSKCLFAQEAVQYLGFQISTQGVHTSKKLLQAIADFPKPDVNNPTRAIKQLIRFLGMAGYYRRFIPHLARLELPLRKLIMNPDKFEWGAEEEKAFETIKERLISAPVLKHIDFTKTFILTTDASEQGIAAVLSQKTDGFDHPVSFASRSLNPREANYSATELELLAIVWSCELYRIYLVGKKFTCYTDHSALIWLFKQHKPNRLLRWMMRLNEFDMDVIHKKGLTNYVADALSRGPLPGQGPYAQSTIEELYHIRMDEKIKARKRKQRKQRKEKMKSTKRDLPKHQGKRQAHYKKLDEKLIEEVIASLTTIPEEPLTPQDRLRSEQRKDIMLQPLLVEATRGNKPTPFFVEDGLLYRSNMPQPKASKESPADNPAAKRRKTSRKKENTSPIYSPPFKLRVLPRALVVPYSMQEPLLRAFHNASVSAHMGRTKTYSRLKRRFWWPGMLTDVERWVNACLLCRKRKTIANKNAGEAMQFEEPEKPFDQIGIDHVGPFKESALGNNYLLTAICFYSRFPFAIPVPDTSGPTAAKALFQHVFTQVGIPSKILSDRGSGFQSDLMKSFYELLGIEKLTTSSYQPSTNGRCERFHRFLGPAITMETRRMDQLDWDVKIPAILFAYRITDTEATGMSPFEAVYGFKPNVPTDLLFTAEGAAKAARYSEANHFNLPLRWRIAHDWALDFRRDYDNKRYQALQEIRKPVLYEVGDLVMLSVPPHILKQQGEDGGDKDAEKSTSKKGLATKLLYRWTGPHRILKRINPNVYQLEGLMQGHDVVNCKRLAIYHPYKSTQAHRYPEKNPNLEEQMQDNVPQSESTARLPTAAVQASSEQLENSDMPSAKASLPQAAANQSLTPQAPSLSAAEKSAKSTLAQASSRKPRLKKTTKGSFSYVTRHPSPQKPKDRQLGKLFSDLNPLSLTESLGTSDGQTLQIYALQANLEKRRDFLRNEITTLEKRMNLPASQQRESFAETESRYRDLTNAAQHIREVNRVYDTKWELSYKDEFEQATKILHFGLPQEGHPIRREMILENLSLPVLPEKVSGYAETEADVLANKKQFIPMSKEASLTKRMNKTVHLSSHLFPPQISRTGRLAGVPSTNCYDYLYT